MDIEWAADGISNKLFIVQARPATIHSRKDHNRLTEYVLPPHGATALVKEIAVGENP